MSLPPVPGSFRWTAEPWGAALRCRPLETVAPHLFTTRQLELSSSDGDRMLREALGARDIVQAVQVHGRDVVTVHGDARPAGRPEADVLVSDARDAAIAVRAADCVPLLIADSRTGAVAAVHAGWRGTAARAAVAGVEALVREFGSQPADLVAAIGPSIGSCCYEVGPDVLDAFAAAGHERRLLDRWFQPAPSPAGAPARARLRLDVAGANRDQLVLAGVPGDQIHVAGLCTAMHLEVLTSYRAERERAGRIAGVIRARGTSTAGPR